MRRFPIFLALLAACPAAQIKDDAGKPRPTAQAFSEPSAVTTLVPVSGGVFVGTSVGLDRWDDAGRRVHAGAVERGSVETIQAVLSRAEAGGYVEV